MPVLKTYSKSYDKDGYYVHAPINGASHPIPLQTPNITARIYRELGYDSGDHVPNKLTWRLYNAGLHWTESSGNTQRQEEGVKEAILEGTGPEFTEDQEKVVLSVIESYNGRFENELISLAKEFDVNDTHQVDQDLRSADVKEYFGVSFEYIENEHFLDDLRTLEEYECIYNPFHLEEHSGARLCRIEFKPEEIEKYVESLISYEEYLSYKRKGYTKDQSVEMISKEEVRERVHNSSTIVPAAFYSEEIEALVCGLRPSRYETIPKSKTSGF